MVRGADAEFGVDAECVQSATERLVFSRCADAARGTAGAGDARFSLGARRVRDAGAKASLANALAADRIRRATGIAALLFRRAAVTVAAGLAGRAADRALRVAVEPLANSFGRAACETRDPGGQIDIQEPAFAATAAADLARATGRATATAVSLVELQAILRHACAGATDLIGFAAGPIQAASVLVRVRRRFLQADRPTGFLTVRAQTQTVPAERFAAAARAAGIARLPGEGTIARA